VTAACAALVLVPFLGASAQVGFQFSAVEFWNTGKGSVSGEQSASSAYPALAASKKRCPVLTERDMLQFS